MTNVVPAMRSLIAVLERLGMEYAIMGGLAIRSYGVPRPTWDVDFTVAIERERLGEFYAAAEADGFTIGEPYRAGWVDEVAGMPLVKLRTYQTEPGVDIDVFLAESPFQKELLRRRRQAEVEGANAWLVSVEDVLLLKLLANRPRDRIDIADVLFMQGQLDEVYLQEWAAKLGVQERLAEALAERGKMT